MSNVEKISRAVKNSNGDTINVNIHVVTTDYAKLLDQRDQNDVIKIKRRVPVSPDNWFPGKTGGYKTPQRAIQAVTKSASYASNADIVALIYPSWDGKWELGYAFIDWR